ncbi:hypothetical protein [Rhizobium leguminosarum]|uniref:hypothetical protein n=1 Tax=Rhizobium leguminosarum TaxID=384 RepID=UPI0013B76A53|nr:hypothetical protein [Rhizobium leguminosarum]MBY5325229.1 hypothetical protein [Rhizobium leguminosarum]MBY5381413.1 hypothetical protein [Rhizobium leguminosarum]MCA2432785.1 hypothetical protein [Rhizobium leguminosarum]NEH74750.1 hypothetical protein [Rhizobium leguminosarum]
MAALSEGIEAHAGDHISKVENPLRRLRQEVGASVATMPRLKWALEDEPRLSVTVILLKRGVIRRVVAASATWCLRQNG